MGVFTGTAARDYFEGTAITDSLRGFAGDDELVGGGGDDNVVGGEGADDLCGGDGADTLRGDSGYDFLVGGQGNDLIDGGTALDPGTPSHWRDVDIVSYAAESTLNGVSVNLALGTATDTFGTSDTLIDIEYVFGSIRGDTLIGGNPANDDYEVFGGLQGFDVIDGGSGYDLAEYYWDRDEGGNLGIVADLESGKVRDGFNFVDTLSNIEEIRATSFSDDLRGSSRSDTFAPSLGSDYIDGRNSQDTVTYSYDVFRGGDGGIDANLQTGVILDTEGWVDTVVSIENVTGSFWDDVIRGSLAGNTLDGQEGNDLLKGREGNDKLLGRSQNDSLYGGLGNDRVDGGFGNDVMRGGGGRDIFIFQRDGDDDSIADFRTGTDRIDVSDYGFANAAEVLALVRVLSADTAIIELGDDNFITLSYVDTGSNFIGAGDLII